ncbi:putative transmembrane protein [Mycolicibacterium cosmeticum]|uniref:Transmembrane protein n=2 Tax=Mycolicibacterium cosmeticum TaxID=258533 RepID=W9BKC4_MYCCO|nr:putative transmembrane protein [Mycolicibacterium cosmeticum]
MYSDPGGYGGGPRPAYPPPGYGGYPGHPGYPGYPPPGHGYYGGYPGPPPEVKPGIIALRPLNLSDIFNGAFAYIRANPKATLGLTTIVVVIAQLFALLLQITPLASSGALDSAYTGEDAPAVALIGPTLGTIAGAVATWVSGIVLAGLLTVIVGRAVFGSGITIGAAWQRLRGRIWALLGFTALEAVGAILLVGVAVGLTVVAVVVGDAAAGFLVGIPLLLGLVILMVYLGTMLSFVPPLIVLERLPILAAVQRSFALIRNDFWRVFGIRLLATMVAGMIAGAVAVPFSFGGQILLLASETTAAAVVGLVLISVGAAIGQILTSPFTAGVVVLQYTDRRIRAEAFDLVLQTGAGAGPVAPADSTDHLWLTRRP